MTHVEIIRSIFVWHALEARTAGDHEKAEVLTNAVVAFDAAREQLARAAARAAGSDDVAGYLADVDQLIDDGAIVCETDDEGLVWTLRAVDAPVPAVH